MQPFIQEGMGWGLKTLEDVKAGTLIREYMGEVPDGEFYRHNVANGKADAKM